MQFTGIVGSSGYCRDHVTERSSLRRVVLSALCESGGTPALRIFRCIKVATPTLYVRERPAHPTPLVPALKPASLPADKVILSEDGEPGFRTQVT